MNPGHEELHEIVGMSSGFLSNLAGSRMLIVGATGFVGTWLTSSIQLANRQLNLEIDLNIAIRNLRKAEVKFGNSKVSGIDFLDMRSLDGLSGFDFLIYAATPSNPSTGSKNEAELLSSSREIIEAMLTISKNSSSPPTFLNLSSGIVYGEERVNRDHLSETTETISAPESAYTKAKLHVEKSILSAANQGAIKPVNARLFAFAGPLISLDGHFAVGQFMKQGMERKTIVVEGNPETVRSYMYPVDMTTWLLASLSNPGFQTIHIGSERALTMRQIASIVSREFDVEAGLVGNPNIIPTHYVPSTKNTRDSLGVSETISLEQAVGRWRRWLESEPGRRVV